MQPWCDCHEITCSCYKKLTAVATSPKCAAATAVRQHLSSFVSCQLFGSLLTPLLPASWFVGVLDMSDFYNDAVNEPDFNIKEDYRRWSNVSHPAVAGHLHHFVQHPQPHVPEHGYFWHVVRSTA